MPIQENALGICGKGVLRVVVLGACGNLMSDNL